MSGDGAHLGVSADRALKTILGGADQPTEAEKRTPEQMAEYLDAAPGEATDYETAAQKTGKVILDYLRQHPEDQDLEAEGHYEFPDGTVESAVMVSEGLSNRLRAHPETWSKIDDGITGYQFGWAVNAAKYALGKPPVANPAIVEVR